MQKDIGDIFKKFRDIISDITEIFGIFIFMRDPTGFVDPENVIITGDPSTRTVTISGTVSAKWRGRAFSDLESGYVSDAHGTDTSKRYVLSYDGTSISWSDSNFNFKNLWIAISFYDNENSTWVYARECHGLMNWEDHLENHITIGTFKYSGGTVSGYTLDSTTAADRRPDISATVIYDEDLPTTIDALSTSLYSHFKLTSTGLFRTPVSQSDIINLSTNNPYFNEFTGGAWTDTLLPANSVATVWLIAVPMCADANSIRLSYMFMQPQWYTLSTGSGGQQLANALNAEKQRQFSELSLGDLSLFEPEFILIARFAITYTASNWVISDVTLISGSNKQLVGNTSGNFLTTVATESRLTGSGTVADPIDLATLTASRAMVTDGSGYPSAATTTATEIGYVNGVTSSVQTQLDAKATKQGAAIEDNFSSFDASGDIQDSGYSGSDIDNKLNISDIDDVPSNDPDVPISSQWIYANVYVTNRQISFYFSGKSYVDDNIFFVIMDFAGTFETARAYANTAPSGSVLELEITKNGSKVFDLDISSGSNSATDATPSITSFSAGDRIGFDIKAIGSTTAGSDIAVSVTYSKSGVSEQISYFYKGDADVKDDIFWIVMDCAGTLDSARAYAQTAPTGSALELEVSKNGTTEFDLDISAGANSATGSSGASGSFVAGDRIGFDIKAIGSTLPGTDISVSVTYTRS
jgi:hypothetical protein